MVRSAASLLLPYALVASLGRLRDRRTQCLPRREMLLARRNLAAGPRPHLGLAALLDGVQDADRVLGRQVLVVGVLEALHALRSKARGRSAEQGGCPRALPCSGATCGLSVTLFDALGVGKMRGVRKAVLPRVALSGRAAAALF
jgi:hypothetical protein